MSGIDAGKVFLPSPVQSKTTGAVAIAPVGTALPDDAGTQLGGAYESGGYISDAGISVSTNKGVTAIKDWSQGTVRKALSDFDGTISLAFLQVDEWSATRLVGEDNVSATAGKLAIDLGPNLPDIETYVFNMKDGDSRVRVIVPCGQITAIDAVSFVPNAANIWPATLSCYVGDDGFAIRVIYEDGTVIDNTPSVTVTPSRAGVVVGAKRKLKAVTVPAGNAVTWTSSDTAKATVDSDGTVTGKAAGTATITASATIGGNSYTDTCSVVVSAS